MQAASTSAGCRTGRLLGKLTPTPEAFTRWTGMMPSAIWHGYTGRRTAGSAAHTALRCTMCRVGALSCSGITAPGASSVLTIAAKGGEAIMKPKKKSRLFQLPALPKPAPAGLDGMPQRHQVHPAKLSDKGRLLPGAGKNRKEARPDIEPLDERTTLR